MRATPAPQGAADGVAVQIGAANALTTVVAFGEHRQQRLIVLFIEIAIGRGLAKHCQQRLFCPFLTTDFGNDLLRQNIQWRFGNVQGVEFATAHAVEQGGAFDQVIAGGGEQTALGRAADLVPGTAHALQESRDGARRGNLADQIDFTDVDAQLQRGGGDQDLQLTALESLFGVEAEFLGQTAVVRGDGVFAQTLAEVTAQAFGQSPGVDENQRGAVFAGQLGEAVVNQLPDIVGHHCRQRHWRHFDAEVPWAGVADVDDLARPTGTDQKPRHGVDGFLCGGQTDAGQRFGAQGLQAFEAQRQVTAAFTGGYGVDFVDDHRARSAEHFAPGLGAEQHVQRFRGGHQNVRRAFAHGGAVFLRGVAGAHGGGDLQLRQAHLAQLLGDPRQRVLQVDADVVGQRLERRNVDHQGFVPQAVGVFQAALDQIVEYGEERGKGFAGARGRGDQRRAALADQRPCARLGGGDRREGAAEPGADGGVKACQGRVRGDGQIHA